jgi:hypothetical protein
MRSIGSLGHPCLLAAALAAACAAPPLYDPPLSHLEVPVDPGSGQRMELLASLRAVPPDREQNLPAGMEARIRLDNETALPTRIDPREIELFARDLRPFGPPAVAPPNSLDVAPGDSAVVTARFAYPAGEDAHTEGLRAVDLRWTVAQAGRPYASEVTFDRVERPPTLSDPWFWEPEPRIVLRSEVSRGRY